MERSAPLETLFYPFTQGELAAPSGKTLFLNAQHHSFLENFNTLDAVQYFYPDAKNLSLIDDPAGAYDAALVLIPKDKTAAQYDLACALQSLNAGGLIVAAAANDANGNRLESWLTQAGLKPQSLSKHKCRVVWAHKISDAPASWLTAGARQQVVMEDDSYWTQPGLFGWDKIDVGSQLLAAHLPALKGHGADFGCGYGYLSRQVLKKNAVTLTAIDADRRAVECCALNCPEIKTVWSDLTQSWTGEKFDWIVMNPPFHDGRTTDADIGASFIATAGSALRKGGVLYMVANRQLPYEPVLKKMFSSFSPVAKEKGFKIMRAVR